jgi:hypothetical protein
MVPIARSIASDVARISPDLDNALFMDRRLLSLLQLKQWETDMRNFDETMLKPVRIIVEYDGKPAAYRAFNGQIISAINRALRPWIKTGAIKTVINKKRGIATVIRAR